MMPLSHLVCIACLLLPRVPAGVRCVVLVVLLMDIFFSPGPSPPQYEPRYLACWDTNKNYRCDPEEDINGDTFCTLDDCKTCPPNQPNCPLYK